MLEHGVMFSLHIFKASSDMNIAVFECFSAREKKKKVLSFTHKKDLEKKRSRRTFHHNTGKI